MFASVVFDSVLGPLRLARLTWLCPCFSVVPEATHEASRGPEKGAVSAKKALRGSETETRELLGGTEENRVSPKRGHWFALQANQWVFTKRKHIIIELVVRPAGHLFCWPVLCRWLGKRRSQGQWPCLCLPRNGWACGREESKHEKGCWIVNPDFTCFHLLQAFIAIFEKSSSPQKLNDPSIEYFSGQNSSNRSW